MAKVGLVLTTDLLFLICFNENVQVFGAFGPVELVQLPPDETGNCKGFGFVQVCNPGAYSNCFIQGIYSFFLLVELAVFQQHKNMEFFGYKLKLLVSTEQLIVMLLCFY